MSDNDLVIDEKKKISKDITKENNTQKINSIEIEGISIQSTTKSLREIEKTIDRIMNKHKDYLLNKKIDKIRGGMFG